MNRRIKTLRERERERSLEPNSSDGLPISRILMRLSHVSPLSFSLAPSSSSSSSSSNSEEFPQRSDQRGRSLGSKASAGSDAASKRHAHARSMMSMIPTPTPTHLILTYAALPVIRRSETVILKSRLASPPPFPRARARNFHLIPFGRNNGE